MGYGTVGIQISGTWSGTISFEATLDAANWVALNVIQPSGSSMVTSATSNAAYVGSVAGCRLIRARMSSFTSGTAQVQLTAVGTSGGAAGGGGGGGGGAVTIADGADVAQGSTTDAAITSDSNGTVIGFLRGLVKIFADVWSSSLHTLKVSQATASSLNAMVVVPAVAVASAVTSVNDSASNQNLLASNASRKGYKLYNASPSIGYVKEGTTATTSDYSYQIQPNGYYECVGLGCYTGNIDCIWSADASGAMKITELT
jgi:hypothetical protein